MWQQHGATGSQAGRQGGGQGGRQGASYSGYAFMCHVHVHVRVQLWLQLQIEQQPLAKWWMCCCCRCWWNMKPDKDRISDRARQRGSQRGRETECELIGKLSWGSSSGRQHKTFRHSQLRQNVTQFKVATNWLANYLTSCHLSATLLCNCVCNLCLLQVPLKCSHCCKWRRVDGSSSNRNWNQNQA